MNDLEKQIYSPSDFPSGRGGSARVALPGPKSNRFRRRRRRFSAWQPARQM